MNSLASGLEFFPANIAGAVQDLALKVRNVDPIGVDQPDRAYSGGCEVECDRRTQPARSNAQNSRGLDSLLPGRLQLRQNKLPGITREVLRIEGNLREAFLIDDARDHALVVYLP